VALLDGVQDLGNVTHRHPRQARVRLTDGAGRSVLQLRRQPMSLSGVWPQVLDFFGTSLVIEPSPGQLSGDAGLRDRTVPLDGDGNEGGWAASPHQPPRFQTAIVSAFVDGVAASVALRAYVDSVRGVVGENVVGANRGEYQPVVG